MGADRRFALACFAAAVTLVAVALRGFAWPGATVLAGIGALFLAVWGWNLWTGHYSEEGDDLLRRLARNAWWLS
jgi:hypothetical protein